MNRNQRAIVALFVGLYLAGPRWTAAQVEADDKVEAAPMAAAGSTSTPTASKPTPDQIKQAIADLGSKDYRVRQKAATRLWLAGRSAEEPLKNAIENTTDFEVSAAAKPILDRFQWGIYPDTPRDVVEAINTFRTGGWQQRMAVINQLGTLHKETLAHDLIARETDANYRQYYQQQYDQANSPNSAPRSRRYRGLAVPEFNRDPLRSREIRQKILAGDYDAADKIFGELLDGKPDESSMRDYAAYLLTRGKLDAKIKELRGKADINDLILVWLLRAQGDFKGAVEIAKKHSLDRVIDMLLADNCDWKELAQRDATIAPVSVVGAISGRADNAILHITAKLTRFHLAGEKEKFSQTVKELFDCCAAQPTARPFAAAMLILNERSDDGLKLWLETDDIEAIEMGCTLERQTEVFKRLGVAHFERDKPDWSALLKFEMSETDVSHFTRACQLAAEIGKLGEKEKAESLLAALEEKVSHETERLPWCRRFLMSMAIEMDDYAWADRLGAVQLAALAKQVNDYKIMSSDPFGDEGPTSEARTIIRLLFEKREDDKRDELAYLLLLVMREKTDVAGLTATLKKLHNILDNGSSSKPAEAAHAAMVAELTETTKRIERHIQSWDDSARASARLVWAKFLQERGLHVQSLRLVSGLSNDLDRVQQWIEAGDICLAEKQWSDAIAFYEKALRADATNPLAVYLLGRAKCGDGKDTAKLAEGRKLIERALVLPLGDAAQREMLADRMRLLGDKDEAMNQDKIVQKVARAGDREALLAMVKLAVACQKKGDYTSALGLWDRLSLRLAEGGQIRNSIYAETPRWARLAHAKTEFQAGRLASGLAEMQRAEALQIDSSELVLECADDLKRLGAKAELDGFYQRGKLRYETTLHEFPRSALHHNNLAWLAGRLNRDLDIALLHAQKAVALKPDQAGYLDTLAEVQFARGNKAEAIANEKRCMAMDPSEDVFEKQLSRFQGQPK